MLPFTFWPSNIINVLIPTSLPPASTSGPPELPGLMGVFVWIAHVL